MRGAAALLAFGLLLACGGGEPERLAAPPPPSERPSPTPEPRELADRAAAEARQEALKADGVARLDALRVLDRVVAAEAARPGNAWALAHGLLAQGRDFQAADGRYAAHVLLDDFLEPDELLGQGLVRYPRRRGDVRVEPHTDLILKTFVEVDLGGWERLRPGDADKLDKLLRGSRLRYAPVLKDGAKPRFVDPDDAPWSVDAWCRSKEGGEAWTTAGGVDVRLDDVAAGLLGTLEQETWFLRQAKAAGRPFEKRRQDIFRYTCGGAHLFQGVATCAARGLPEQGNASGRVRQLVELYLYRVPVETGLVDQGIASYPQLAPVLYNQDIKFLGHLLEGLGKAERDGLWTPSAEERALLDQAETRLVFHVLQQEKLGTYGEGSMKGLREAEDKQAQNPMEGFQFYLDLVGDACHAVNGLRIQAEQRAKRG